MPSLEASDRGLRTTWEVAGVPVFCSLIGIDYEAWFLRPLRLWPTRASLYDQHIWTVLPHSALPHTGVLHAYPSSEAAAELAWEEWFLSSTGPRHHVLQRSRQSAEDEVFAGEVSDIDHPPAVLGSPWYYSPDPDLSPRALRP